MNCQQRNCDDNNPAGFPRWSIPNVIESNICLLPMVTAQTRRLLKLHQHYSNGLMLVSGGVIDQPNFYLQAMEIIDRATT